jgi:hypothetical protein
MYKTARRLITEALVDKIKLINGTGSFSSNLYNNVEGKLKFWDEVSDFPFVSVVAGLESREYHPSEFAWAYLIVDIKVYVKSEDAQSELDSIIGDIEHTLDLYENLQFDTDRTVTSMRIIKIETDGGVLDPIGVGDISVLVRYDIGNTGI